jgi:hypothetical protein
MDGSSWSTLLFCCFQRFGWFWSGVEVCLGKYSRKSIASATPRIGEENSKMRMVEFDKGLKFLGVLFKSGTIAPPESVVNKFKSRN